MSVGRFFAVGLLCVAAVPCGCGKKKAEEAAGPAKGTPEYAIADAVQRIDAKDYKGFLEHFFPAEELREIRDRGMVDQFAARIKDVPEFKKLVDILRKARSVKPEISEDGTWATFKVVFEQPDPRAAKIDVPPLPDGKDLKLKGYGDDLKQVLAKALIDLKAKKFEVFIDSLFPASELAALEQEKRRERLIAALNATADDELVLPMSTARMIADLTSMRSLEPQIEDNGQTAVFVLPAVPDPPEQALPERTVKLQLVAGSWRFYDNVPAIRAQSAEMVKNARRQKLDHPTYYVALEKFGDDWRMAKITDAGDPRPTQPRRGDYFKSVFGGK